MSEVRIVDVTVVSRPGVHPHGELAWSPESGRISYLGPIRGPVGPVDLDGRGRLVMPGLVNGHSHAGMAMLRGYSDDVPLHDWLGHIRAVELRLTAADIRASLTLAMAEMLRSGTVGFLDMFAWDTDLLGDVVEAGLRVSAAPAVFGADALAYPSASPASGTEVLDGVPALAATFAGEPRVTVGYAIHAPYTCPPELIADVAQRCRSDGRGVQIHLSETRREVTESLAQHGVSPIALVARLGLLDHRVHVAHAVHLEAGDIELLARDSVTVAYNPVSNGKLGAGVAPVPDLLAAGVRLSLGTDSVASNNTLDLFEEIKTGVLVQRAVSERPEAVSGADMLAMATSGGATALDQGLSGVLGVGEPADLVLVDITGTTATPLTDPTSFLSYAARGTDVTDVVIAGRRVVADRRCLNIDEEAARARVSEGAHRIRAELAAAGLAPAAGPTG